eukprot:gene23705-biopygen1284
MAPRPAFCGATIPRQRSTFFANLRLTWRLARPPGVKSTTAEVVGGRSGADHMRAVCRGSEAVRREKEALKLRSAPHRPTAHGSSVAAACASGAP